MTTLLRIVASSWKHFFRNAWIGLAMMVVFSASLLTFNVFLGMQALLGQAVHLLEDRVDVTLSFLPTAPEAVVTQARFYFGSLPQVSGVKVVTPSEALAAFRDAHIKDGKILSALDEVGENPFGAQLVIKAKRAEDYPFVLEAIRHPQYASFIQTSTFDDHAKAIERLEQVGRQLRLAGAFLVVLFAVFALLIIFHSVRVAIYTHRDEIAIMRLVGATSSFIRAPFILEGIWIALLSTILAAVVTIIALPAAEAWVRPLFDGAEPGLIAYFKSQGELLILLEGGGLMALVAAVSSLAVGRYIRR
jgi:cell division transport system permease protein